MNAHKSRNQILFRSFAVMMRRALNLTAQGMFLLVVLIVVFHDDNPLISPSYAKGTDNALGKRPFMVYDATLYKNKPDLSKYGIHPLNILYVARFYEKGEPSERMPSRNRVKKIAQEAATKGEMIVIDIEQWPVKGDDAVVADSVRKYTQLAKWMHEFEPRLRIGFYALPPLQDYYRAISGPGSTEYTAWQKDNDRLRSIVAAVDVLFPSAYTFFANRQEWKQYAIEQIREARRFEKPVYVFLWPQYHESNRFYGETYLSPEYWRLELETAREYADGVVIWGGWSKGGPASWDEQAPWWRVTQKFMSQMENQINTR